MYTEKIPLVSVIIPMFNAARFIPQTLESLLVQTLKDFEVIIVDDCSTDKSVEVVENFMDAFAAQGIRLHLIESPTNAGAPSFPRNLGVQFSRGKYLAFLDNDDLFMPTALEELVTLAENFSTDVVNMPEIFWAEDNGSSTDELLNPANHRVLNCRGFLREPNEPSEEKIFVFPEDIGARVGLWLEKKFHWSAWASFCSRDFWIANQIKFPAMPVSDDTLTSFACLCFAGKILSVPNIVYIQRQRADSISRGKDAAEKFIHKWLSNLILGFKNFDEIMGSVPFFSQHPDFRYAVLDWFFIRNISDAQRFPEIYAQIPVAVLNRFVEKEFSSDAAFAAYLFNTVNIQRLMIAELRRELAEFQKQ
ncbi:MAG: glycosyltransferase family 2 protein [Selenomonadaceae bacterium]|nr:glycosyltransferase family 2 protein [Selenomonadaceae bacterium]MBQ3727465.1 glycosyltransferase family 2 protein [Selenomonadaceae bacterium]